MATRPVQTELLERDRQLELAGELLARAQAGSGGVLLVEGPPGQGKTSLLRAVRGHARDAGFEVLAAVGSELERDAPLGAVRQLLEPELRAADPDRRTRLLSGAAALAAPALGLTDDAPTAEDASHVRSHGLFWLCANLAEEGATMLVVDDAQWVDEPSMRFLEHLGRRVEDLSLLLVVGTRPAESDAARDALDRLARVPAAEVVDLAPLSPPAVEELLSAQLGRGPDAAFAAACQDATRGNPLLVRELLRALVAQRFEGRAAEAQAAARLVPGTIARAVGLRMRALPADAHAVARSVAILGDGRRPRPVAALAELPEAAVAVAHDALAQAAVLERDSLTFVHPLIRQAVLDDLVGTERARLHERALEVLREHEASDDDLVSHLLACEPCGEAWRADVLAAVATRALADGAPSVAARLLGRALEEPPAPDRRDAVLLALGTAEARLGAPDALRHLDDAAGSTDADIAAAAQRQATSVLVVTRRPGEAADGLRAAAARLGPDRPDLAEDLEADLLDVLLYDEGGLAELAERLEAGRQRGDKRALSSLAFQRAEQGAAATEVADLAARALAGGELLAAHGPDRSAIYYAIEGLMIAERPDEAAAALEQSGAATRRSGSLLAAEYQALMWTRWQHEFGDLRRAEDEARRPAELFPDRPSTSASPTCALAIALLDQGRLQEAEATLNAMAPTPGLSIDGELAIRGRLRLAQGRYDEALQDLRGQQEVEGRRGWVLTGREERGPSLITALARLGRLDEARQVGRDEIALAERREAPAAQAKATMALAFAYRDEGALELLREAVDLARASRSPFTLASALTELGGALRRGNQRVASREVLREARDAADRCGAAALEKRAYDELIVAGGRPRSKHVSGVDALTRSELRVAELAASGLTNREMAESLFVTIKTVESQLGSVYGKLDIRARGQLAAALAPVA